MKKLLLSLILFITSPALVAQNPECSLCVGIETTASDESVEPVPRLVRLRETDDASLAALASLQPSTRARTVLVIELDAVGGESLEAIDHRLRTLARRLASGGAFRAAGLAVPTAVSDELAWAARRFAVMVQSEGVAAETLIEPSSVDTLDRLIEGNAVPYFDIVLASSVSVEAALAWTLEHDPAKRVHALVRPASPNLLHDAALALAHGARVVFVDAEVDTAPFVALNRAMSGDWVADTAMEPSLLDRSGAADRTQSAVVFVRGEDLATVVVPEGTADPVTILSVDSGLANPRIIRGTVEQATDTGERGGRRLVAIESPDRPFAVIFDRPQIVDPAIQREEVDVAAVRATPVEEIVRAHQAYWDFQAENTPPYIADNDTSLRFTIGNAGDVIESTITGPHFFSDSANDWLWEDLYLNGVRWKYGKIPELPLIQPEKVTQLPLEIHLGRDYRYALVRETDRDGYQTWEVAFEPPLNAPPSLPLYRGRVWIDKRTGARVAISTIQLNLSGDVLSNEETLRYAPFSRADWSRLTADRTRDFDPRDLLWLPVEVSAQQTLSAAGRSTPILRQTNFSDFRIAPSEFEALRLAAHESRFRMVRETESGLRYLEKGDGPERYVEEGIDSSRLFLLGGLQHDDGLEYGVLPLGGIDYFDFDLFDRGLQTNIFFAGVIVAANLTDPSFAGTRANVGADFFALAIPFENSIYRDGIEMEDEAVEAHPFSLTLRAGHPFGIFGKVDLSIGMTQVGFGRAETTREDFTVPVDTFVLSPALHARYDRWGWSIATFYEYNIRSDWEPWGVLSEYSENHKEFDKFGASVSKSFHLPNFQRVSAGVEWVGGNHLDRFSKYSIDFWGSTRVRGFSSQSVQAEEGWFGHFSYGLVISDQLRVESFYDLALLDDASSGLDGDLFQGVGLAGQTIGPWGTLVRFDVGKSIGDNAQDGFVASVLFLKLFD